jgi:malonyl-CoA O-methyltransferase
MQAERSTGGPPGPRLDAVALARTTARLSARGQPPWLHEEAARRLAERLPLIKAEPTTVLDWSGPLGASTSLLQAAYPRARQWAVSLAGEAAGASGPTPKPGWWSWSRRAAPAPEWRRADELPAAEAGLLWSNMMLHGAVDPQAVFARWHRAVAVGGFLMFSTLGPGSLPELRRLYRALGWGEAMAPLVDMHDLGDMLVHAGFADPVMDQEQLQLTWPDADALLSELRSWGANLSPRRHAGLRTPRWREQLARALTVGADGERPALTVELVYGHAFRVAPRPRVQAETAVSLDEMRTLIRSPKP